MPLLNLPQNGVYPPKFIKALSNANEAARLMGKEGDPIGVHQLRDAVRLLAESNALLVHVLTDGDVK